MIPRFEPVADPRPLDTPWPNMVWPVPAGTVLTGSTVQLSPLDPGRDSHALFAALDHEQVWKYVPLPRPACAQGLGDVFATRARQPQWQQWTIRTLRACRGVPAGTIVGTTSFTNVSATDARLEIGATFYTPRTWGSVVNPESKFLLLQLAFERLRVGRVELRTDTRNTRSQLAITRLGAVYEGTHRRYARRPDGTVRDIVLFSLIAEEWPAVREHLAGRVAHAAQRDADHTRPARVVVFS